MYLFVLLFYHAPYIGIFCFNLAAKILFYVILFCLVGSAGLGVLKMAAQAVSRMSGGSGTATTANSPFFLIDKDVCFHVLCFQCALSYNSQK